jgi:hypothetical protein
MGLLIAQKKTIWRERPRYDDAEAFILRIFDSASREPIRKLLTEVWGPGKTRTPRNPRN